MDILSYLTPAEKKLLNRRQRVHRWLIKGYGVREIARLEKVSTTTVVNIKKYLGLRIRKLRKDRPFLKKPKVPWKIG